MFTAFPRSFHCSSVSWNGNQGSIFGLLPLALIGLALQVLAGPGEEVAQIVAQSNQTEHKCLDARVGAYDDNAVLRAFMSCFGSTARSQDRSLSWVVRQVNVRGGLK